MFVKIDLQNILIYIMESLKLLVENNRARNYIKFDDLVNVLNLTLREHWSRSLRDLMITCSNKDPNAPVFPPPIFHKFSFSYIIIYFYFMKEKNP